MKEHKITIEEYRLKYPNTELINEESRLQHSQDMTGRKGLSRFGMANPFFGRHHTEKSKELIKRNAKHLAPWNKGLSAKTNSKVKDNIDKASKKLHERFVKGELISPKKGISWKDYYGENKAKEISQKLSRTLSDGRLNGPNNPNYNHHKLAGCNNPNYGKPSLSRGRKHRNESRELMSTAAKRNHADPNSKYNTVEYLKQLNCRGHKGYSIDGHFCSSRIELEFDNWLFLNNIIHMPHPRISQNNGRRADYLVNTYCIEVDGWGRDTSYWEAKYNRTNIIPIIVCMDRFGRGEFSDKDYFNFFSKIASGIINKNIKIKNKIIYLG